MCAMKSALCNGVSYYTARITTQPRDVTLFTGGMAVFTCVVDRNGATINSSDVMWEQIRVGGGTTKLHNRGVFNITTTISGDILTSTLTISGATHSGNLGTSLYRCVVNDVMSRNASLYFSTGREGKLL